MKLIQVNYKREQVSTAPDLMARLTESANRMATLPGLVWKVWGYDDATLSYSGFYLFDNEASARAFGDGRMIESLSSQEDVSEIRVTYFDVDERLTHITRGPLG